MATTSSWMTTTIRLLLEKGIHRDKAPPHYQQSPYEQTHGRGGSEASCNLGIHVDLECQDLAVPENGASEDDEPDD